MTKKQGKSKTDVGDVDKDPVSTEVAAACARGLGGAVRFLSQHHLMGPGVKVEVLARDHFVISAPDPKDPSKNGCVRHVRVMME